MHSQPVRSGYWSDFPDTYRHEQIATMARWVAAGESGALIGGSGTGKSNLVGFLNTRPDVLATELPNPNERFILLHFDVNSLPALTLTYFYRGLIQTIQNAPGLDDNTRTNLAELTNSSANWEDAFFVLSTLQKAHRLLIDGMRTKVVWLLDRFDEACQRLDAQALGSLRSLRDQMKGQLCYIVATRHPIERLRDPAEIDEFYELVAANRCWIGPMVERDARWIVWQMGERLGVAFSEEETVRLIDATGGLPAFLKEACTAHANRELTLELPAPQGDTAVITQLAEALLARPEVERNCREIWTDLQRDEQATLTGIVVGSDAGDLDKAALNNEVLNFLQLSKLVTGEPVAAFSPILAAYVRTQNESTPSVTQRGMSLHPKTRSVVRDGVQLNIELTNHEDRLLAYFLEHVEEVCTKDSLMDAIWPDEQVVEGIRDDRLAQLVKRLRDKIEPMPNNPQYVLTVRGRGYRFVQAES